LPVAALVIVGAVAAIAIASSGGDDVSPREKVAACMRAHGLARPAMERRPRAGESAVQRGNSAFFDPRAFASCTWPPGPGANPDGYAAVIATGVQSGGATEATGNTVADRVEADCKQVELAYTFASMGVFRPIPRFRATPGTIWQFRANISGSGEFG